MAQFESTSLLCVCVCIQLIYVNFDGEGETIVLSLMKELSGFWTEVFKMYF